ncbi:hypothetical protein MIDIC_590033 [Alphaproteobacteria bacterium]
MTIAIKHVLKAQDAPKVTIKMIFLTLSFNSIYRDN